MQRNDDQGKEIRIASYDELESFVRAFAGGTLNLLILTGRPGLQKSRLVRDAVGPAATWFDGNATPFGIYTRLWEHRDEPVVFDDVDGLQASPAGVRLLKGLCQTDPIKTLRWDSDAATLKARGIPRAYPTSSHVLLITNRWRADGPHTRAVQDRGHLIAFDPAPEEVHRRTASWFWDQQIFDFVADHLHLIDELSMRDYHRAWELKRSGLDWRKYWLDRGLAAPACHVARLRADRDYASEEGRARAFVASGWGCRATYFNHARKLKPPDAPIRLTLANTGPPDGEEPDGPTLLDALARLHGTLGSG